MIPCHPRQVLARENESDARLAFRTNRVDSSADTSHEIASDSYDQRTPSGCRPSAHILGFAIILDPERALTHPRCQTKRDEAPSPHMGDRRLGKRREQRMKPFVIRYRVNIGAGIPARRLAEFNCKARPAGSLVFDLLLDAPKNMRPRRVARRLPIIG